MIAVISYLWIGIALVTGFYLIGRPAPYGRHAADGWGPTVPHRVGWVVMELVSPVSLVSGFLVAGGTGQPLMLALWLLDYANRALLYPFRASWSQRRMPLAIAGSAVFFNLINGSINGVALALLPTATGSLFAVGLVLFMLGAAINLWADETLLSFGRSAGGYQIPTGVLYRWISCPNYLGEIVQWSGFALMAWNPAALSFAVWTAANLIPRALSHHQWYRQRFPHYPTKRRAIVPGVL